MSKTLKILALIVFLTLSVIVMASCGGKTSITIELVDADADYSFTQGTVDLGQIRFLVKDAGGNTIETKGVTGSMLSAEDLQKLETTGIYTITINYEGQTLKVQVEILAPDDSASYTLTFDAGEGGYFPGETGSPRYYTITTRPHEQDKKDVVTAIPVPRRVSYRFEGWYKTATYDGATIQAGYEIKYTHTLYAKWSYEEKRTIIFMSQQYDETVTMEVEYGSDVTPPQEKTFEDLVFLGWYYQGTLYAKGQKITNVTENGYIEARYADLMMTVTFISEVWPQPVQKQVKYKTDLSDIPGVPEKTGHTGVWVDKVTGKAPVYTSVITDITVEAVYTIKVFTVNFFVPETGGNDNYALQFTRNQNYGTRINPIPAVEVKEGYNGKWEYLDGNWTSADTILANPITASIDIYARYTIKQFTLTYKYGAHTVNFTHNYNTLIETPYDTSVTHDPKYYTITWYTSATLQFAAEFPFNLKVNTTLHGKIVENPLIVDFYLPESDNEGNPLTIEGDRRLSSVLVKKGEKATAPSFINPKYYITGWTDRNGNAVNLNNIQDFQEYNADPALDRAFYAVVAIRFYTVKYYNMYIETGDETMPYFYRFSELNTSLYKYGTKIIDPPAGVGEVAPFALSPIDDYLPKYPGQTESTFRFDGWYTAADYNSARIYFNEGYTVTGEVSFYTKWTDTELGTEGLSFSPILDEDNGDIVAYALTGFTPTLATYEEIYIPRNHNDKPVASIEKTAFMNIYTPVSYIKISRNIMEIEEGSFVSLRTLKGFLFIDNEISDYFAVDGGVLFSRYAENLLCYPAGLTAETYTVPAYVFIDAFAFGINRIAAEAFATNGNLKTLSFAGDIYEIGVEAFWGCQKLETITLPDTLYIIGDSAFEGCAFLRNINYTDNIDLYYVGRDAFIDTAWLIEKTETVITLAKVLIRYCGDDTELTLDDNIRTIADGAFYKDEVTTLNLIRINISATSSLSLIGYGAFANCANLREIFLLAPQTVDFMHNSFQGISGSAKIYIPAALEEEYMSLLGQFNPEQIIKVG